LDHGVALAEDRRTAEQLVAELPDEMRAVAEVFSMGDGPRTFFF
jgi:hypothetical protein